MILPRHTDGKLRYQGGHTRVVAVNRYVSFDEFLVKMGELCGTSVSLRCQLPSEDLDALISVTSDEDLANLIEEYDKASSSLKIRAFISPPKSTKKISPLPSRRSNGSVVVSPPFRPSDRCTHHVYNTLVYQRNALAKAPQYVYYPYHKGGNGHACLVHNGYHWQ